MELDWQLIRDGLEVVAGEIEAEIGRLNDRAARVRAQIAAVDEKLFGPPLLMTPAVPAKQPRSAAPARARATNGAGNGAEPAPAHTRADKGRIGPETVAGRVLEYLTAREGHMYTGAEIAAALKIEPTKRALDACVALRAAGRIERPEPKRYRAVAVTAASPKPAPVPVPTDGNGHARETVEDRVHSSHEIWRDGSLLKCRECRTAHTRETAFAGACRP